MRWFLVAVVFVGGCAGVRVRPSVTTFSAHPTIRDYYVGVKLTVPLD